jgi:hypothetical protein
VGVDRCSPPLNASKGLCGVNGCDASPSILWHLCYGVVGTAHMLVSFGVQDLVRINVLGKGAYC